MNRVLALVLVSCLSLLGCAKTARIDPGSDCKKETFCGPCASRGGCAWCGGADGQGQCQYKDAGQCAAPAVWSVTPDRCPPPPEGSGTTHAAAYRSEPATASNPSESPPQAALRRTLSQAFPQAKIGEDLLDGLVQIVVRRRKPGQAGPIDPTLREQAPLQKTVREKDHRLYLGDADHHRVKSMPPVARPMQSRFSLPLPMVRVALPQALSADNSVIKTELGAVDLRRDHLLGSVDLIAAKYAGREHLGYRPARVDLITPARLANGRFGAMAVYLGYRSPSDRAPSFYLLEAGTATGDAKMIYFSPAMQPIEQVTSYYLPTPFVTMRYTYSGGLTMQAAPNEDEPDQLIVRSFAQGEREPYITVTVKYRRAPTLELPLPIELTADAGARVAVIARTMGVSAVELQDVLANFADNLHWLETPRYVDPGQAPASR